MQLLAERKQSGNPLGQTATSILVFQDILIVFLLILVPALGSSDTNIAGLFSTVGMALLKAIGALAVVYVVGRFLLQPLLAKVVHFAEEELFTAFILLIIIATASFTGYAGLSLPLGAFLAGLIISETHFCYMVKAEIHPFRTLLLGLFFISVGTTLDLSFLLNNGLTVLAVVIALMGLKVVTLIPVALLQKRTLLTSTQLGLWLSQAGEFGFVLFGLAYSSQIFDQSTYQILMVAIGVSFVITPLMISASDKLGKQADCSQPDSYDSDGKVLILGFGPEGKNIARLLHAAGIEYLGIDDDLMRISTAKSQGFNVAMGTPEKSSLYTSIHAGDAKAVIFALDSDQHLAKYIERLNKRFPHLVVFANVVEEKYKTSLAQSNATAAVFDKHQNGLDMGQTVLQYFGKPKDQINTILNAVIA